MILAELANKIRTDTDIARSEDILTSIVFGSLRYLNPYELLIPFLSKSVQAFDKAILGSILNNGIPFDRVEYYFWPKFENGKEPDMVILFDNSQKKREPILILIEIKYHSGKSSVEKAVENNDSDKNYDQLANYFFLFWSNNFEPILAKKFSDISKDNKYMIYLTKHRYTPKDELDESLRSKIFMRTMNTSLIENFNNGLYWLSWKELERVIINSPDSHTNQQNTAHKETKIISEDLKHFLTKRNLIFAPQFKGFEFIKDICNLQQFDRDTIFYKGTLRFNWPFYNQTFEMDYIFYNPGG